MSTERAPRHGWVEWLESRMRLTELFSFFTHFGLVYTPIDTTRPMREVIRLLGSQRIPRYDRWPHVLGPLMAVLFGLEVFTGLLLSYYYQPSSGDAFASARTIVRDLPFGWFLHQMHTWGSYALVAVVALRLLRLFWDGLWRAPREVLWCSAVAATWLALQADFTGRLLVWDTHSYWSVVRGLEVVFALPVAGPMLSFLLGGRVITDHLLIRFYILHIVVLPLLFAATMYATFATLRRVGLSAPEGRTVPTTTHREYLFSLVRFNLVLFAGLVTLAVLAPLPFFGIADPYTTPANVRPPWYMLSPWLISEKLPVPVWLTGSVLLAIAIAVLLMPLWARGKGIAEERRIRLAGTLLLAVWVALTVAGALVGRK